MNYKTLPKGYRFAGTMDFTRNRKQILAMFKLSVALVVIPAAIGLAVCPPWVPWRELGRYWPMWLITAAMLIAYIPLHELTHGIVMHALSGVRPTYGFKLPYAYAGSTVWFDRRSHILTALARAVVLAPVAHPDIQPVRLRGRHLLRMVSDAHGGRPADPGHRRAHAHL